MQQGVKKEGECVRSKYWRNLTGGGGVVCRPSNGRAPADEPGKIVASLSRTKVRSRRVDAADWSPTQS
jgi:hypothetical protein